MINWHIVTSTMYHEGTPIDGHMYFLSDTKEIYRGTASFTESVVLYNELPTAPAIALNKLYINATTLEGRIWNGTDWTIVVKAVSDTVSNEAGVPVSGKAVIDYLSDELAKLASAADTVSNVEWDATEHQLDVTKGTGDSATVTHITFDGLGVNLQYVSSTGELQLLDASGNEIGDPVNLGLEKFVSSGEYDPETQNIILYFDAEKTESVTIPVGSLVDTYTAEASDTVDMTVSDNKFVANVKISTAEGNQLTKDENGLYVAPVDVSGKMDKVEGAIEGDIAVFDAEGNVVDSGKSFDDIAANTNIFTGVGSVPADIIPEGTTPAHGDIAIVKTQIGETDKYQHTAYVYDETNGWQAMDGNYNAENVFFSSDLMTTSAIGNITLTNGQATIAAAGKNLVDVWKSIFIKPEDPKVTQPSVTLTFAEAKAYEVGTSVTPNYKAVLNAGSYSFGPETGITATSWAITAIDNGTTVGTATTYSGSFDPITVADDTKYSIKAVATYDDGAVPNNNIGEVGAGQIKAGSKEATKGTITGFRNFFYGTMNTTDVAELTSANIRKMTAGGKAAAANTKFTINVPKDVKMVVFAYDASVREATTVMHNGFSQDILNGFLTTTVDVEGVGGFTAKTYRVYYQPIVEGNLSATTYTVTI